MPSVSGGRPNIHTQRSEAHITAAVGPHIGTSKPVDGGDGHHVGVGGGISGGRIGSSVAGSRDQNRTLGGDFSHGVLKQQVWGPGKAEVEHICTLPDEPVDGSQQDRHI